MIPYREALDRLCVRLNMYRVVTVALVQAADVEAAPPPAGLGSWCRAVAYSTVANETRCGRNWDDSTIVKCTRPIRCSLAMDKLVFSLVDCVHIW